METKKQFKDRFQDALDAAGKNRAQLSRETGISESMLSHYAAGKYIPRNKKLVAISEALNVAPGWLLFGEEATGNDSADALIETYEILTPENKKHLLRYAAYLKALEGQEADDGIQAR